MPTGVGLTRWMLEDVAKNHLDSDKVELILEQATQCELMVVFTAKRELHIPYALFDGRPNSYQFVHGGRVEATSEDPIKFLHQEFRQLIKPRIPLGTDDVYSTPL
ncbi:uncharacterized protein EI90DRAFT_3011695 [Cantharellus anzutake]|uniref:uncharacterized protein n=1 Tax=Cantharellus anzutake TaxID=1750568 RepID=UPI0019064A25|nr:uncharacterized protein EI90DRAFT_3011695 [Cantharellus anzutake]KAF8342171.1 hypothetical protein EI90DRAFT_3011695 [Cantharellus anzutake]